MKRLARIGLMVGCIALSCACGAATEDDSSSTQNALENDPASDRIVQQGKIVDNDWGRPRPEYSARSVVEGYLPNTSVAQALALVRDTGRWTEIAGYHGERFFSRADLRGGDSEKTGVVVVQEPVTLEIPVRFTSQSVGEEASLEIINSKKVTKVFLTVVDPGQFWIRAQLRPYQGGVIAHFETQVKLKFKEESAAASTGEHVFDWMREALRSNP